MCEDLIHEELSKSIIGAAMTVLNILRPGLDEKLYERAMVIELRKRGHKVDQQRQFIVHYEGEVIGSLVPDLIVDDLVIADPKVVSVQRKSLRSNDWLSHDHESSLSPAPEFQKSQAGMEANRSLGQHPHRPA